mgnify:CR=1 FL=1
MPGGKICALICAAAAATGDQQEVQQQERSGDTGGAESGAKKPAPDLVMEDGFGGGWKPELEPKGKQARMAAACHASA